MAKCTRCSNEKRVISILMARPGSDVVCERVCGDCLTDPEIARKLGRPFNNRSAAVRALGLAAE